jgi:hypothetical protein
MKKKLKKEILRGEFGLFTFSKTILVGSRSMG